MDGSRRVHGPAPVGYYLTIVGAIALVVSLFLTWYDLELPASVGATVDAETNALPPGERELVRAFGQAFLGVFEHVDQTAWQAFDTADVLLLVAGLASAALALAGVGLFGRGRAFEPGQVLAFTGAATGAMVLVKMLDQPEPAQIFGLGAGPLVALAGAAAIMVGGGLAAGRR
jgi:hypothetical protein